ncbi:hypothetical protein [Amycolatopsis sp. FU40]|uniref:hypothetical protein n=1 Tax=Amycolatopsis sp. FU40 TaxID=2914159 RepID=UPI00351D4AA9
MVLPRNLATTLVETLPQYPPARMAPLRIPMTYLEGTDADPLSEMSRHAGDLREPRRRAPVDRRQQPPARVGSMQPSKLGRRAQRQ